MSWHNNGTIENLESTTFDLRSAACHACGRRSIWRVPQSGRKAPDHYDSDSALMIFPHDTGEISPPTSDMPPNVKSLYNEAATVFGSSPRSAAALLRLCLQVLLKELGLPGRNINKDIAALVERGLPVSIQQAMDVLRVVGNNAVHPGQIDLDENRDTAKALFSLLNLVVESQITSPRKVQELFSSLPGTARAAIERRDQD